MLFPSFAGAGCSRSGVVVWGAVAVARASVESTRLHPTPYTRGRSSEAFGGAATPSCALGVMFRGWGGVQRALLRFRVSGSRRCGFGFWVQC